jgi:RNA polymerase sigma factor (sigma-70 family)
MAYDADTAIGGRAQGFPRTRPTLIRMAGSAGNLGREALGGVMELYWKPAYKHIRIKWRLPNEEAKDLTQGFFAELVDGDVLSGFDPDRGSFRNYFRTCLDHFVLKQRESSGRLKRGGGAGLHLDFESAERELADFASESVEDVFLREWRRQMLQLAVEDLRAMCADAGKALQYRLFEQYDLAEDNGPSYSALADEHGIAVTTVTNYLAWARRELRRLAQQRLAAVTSDASELQRESRVLFCDR